MPLVKEREQAQRLLLAKKNYAPSLKTRAKNAARVLFSPFKRPYDLLWSSAGPRRKILTVATAMAVGVSAAALTFLTPWAALPILASCGGGVAFLTSATNGSSCRFHFINDIRGALLASLAIFTLGLPISACAWSIHDMRDKALDRDLVHRTIKAFPHVEPRQSFLLIGTGGPCEAKVTDIVQTTEKSYESSDSTVQHVIAVTVPERPYKSFWTGAPKTEELKTSVTISGPYRAPK